MQVKACFSPRDLAEMTGLDRFRIYRLRKRHGWGRVIYLSDLKELEPLWESILLREQLTG